MFAWNVTTVSMSHITAVNALAFDLHAFMCALTMAVIVIVVVSSFCLFIFSVWCNPRNNSRACHCLALPYNSLFFLCNVVHVAFMLHVVFTCCCAFAIMHELERAISKNTVYSSEKLSHHDIRCISAVISCYILILHYISAASTSCFCLVRSVIKTFSQG